jgi:hypothetical protein
VGPYSVWRSNSVAWSRRRPKVATTIATTIATGGGVEHCVYMHVNVNTASNLRGRKYSVGVRRRDGRCNSKRCNGFAWNHILKAPYGVCCAANVAGHILSPAIATIASWYLFSNYEVVLLLAILQLSRPCSANLRSCSFPEGISFSFSKNLLLRRGLSQNLVRVLRIDLLPRHLLEHAARAVGDLLRRVAVHVVAGLLGDEVECCEG